MIIRENTRDSVSTITLAGTLDALSAPELQSFSENSALSPNVVLDLSDVDFLDSSGLRVIRGMALKKRESGGDVILACMNDDVRKVFNNTQLVRLFHIYDDLDAAVTYAETNKKSI